MTRPVREKVKTSTPTAQSRSSISTVTRRQRQRKLLFPESTEPISQGKSRKQICSANHLGSYVNPETRVAE